MIAVYHLRKKPGCGIPILEWIIVEFTLTILKYFTLIFLACFVFRCITRIPHFFFAWFLIFSWIQVSWMIYGYSIYFSDENDCSQHPETYGWTIFFIILLFIGLLFIIQVVIYTLCCCCQRE